MRKFIRCNFEIIIFLWLIATYLGLCALNYHIDKDLRAIDQTLIGDNQFD